MAYIVTGEDILIHALELAGEASTNASPYFVRAKKYVMRYLADVAKMAPFPAALKSPNGLIAVPEAITDSVLISGVTWEMNTAITISQSGNLIVLNSQNVPYRITSHISNTAIITADATYTEVIVTGDASIITDQVPLASDVLKVWYAWFRGPVNETRTIKVVVGTESLSRYSTNDQATQYALGIVTETDNIPLARIVPWLTDAATIEYVYSRRPTELTFDSDIDTDIPWLNTEDRYVISEMAAARVMLDKRDTRADALALQARNRIREMAQMQCGMDLIEPKPSSPELK